MLLTRQTDYSLRIIRALAGGDKISASQLKDMEMIPQPFAYKITKKLQNAGIIASVRGADGGFRLVADLETLSLYDVMAAVEESMVIKACLQQGYVCELEHNKNGDCSYYRSMAKVQRSVDKILKECLIKDMLDN